MSFLFLVHHTRWHPLVVEYPCLHTFQDGSKGVQRLLWFIEFVFLNHQCQHSFLMEPSKLSWHSTMDQHHPAWYQQWPCFYDSKALNCWVKADLYRQMTWSAHNIQVPYLMRRCNDFHQWIPIMFQHSLAGHEVVQFSSVIPEC